ncbi:PAS domain-containing sensor histidine kinase [Bacteroidota bacterium]
MAYKRFTLFLIVKLCLIFILMVGISLIYIFLEKEQLIFTFIVLGIILAYLIHDLITYINTTNRLLAKFLLSIRHNDFTINFNSQKSSSSISELNKSFQEIIDAFKAIKIEKEVQFNFLQRIIEIIPIGLIAINKSGKMVLMNSAAENLLQIKKPGMWDQLGTKLPEFYKRVNELNGNGRFLIDSENEKAVLAVQINKTVLLESEHRIISLKNIKTEIDLKETEAWIKLIRTLNHEIMNSVTPISSLTDTILMILQDGGNDKSLEEINHQNIYDVVGSVKTIQQRSNRLIDFISEYRKFTKIPHPKKENLDVLKTLNSVVDLLKAELINKGISYKIISENNVQINADPILVEQLIINLIKNSIEALDGVNDPEIILKANIRDDGHICIGIIDNGMGVPAEIQDDIFIPFFSTKDGGSGIGLSLSRQIMRLHGGTISVSSSFGEQTEFTLLF